MPTTDILRLLTPETQAKALHMLDLCRSRGCDLLIYCTARSCAEQAKIYRATRTLPEIQAKARDLEARGLPFLAKVLMDVGPQSGPLGKHMTKAGPGESWHQYGMAFDGVPMVDGKPDWDGVGREWDVFGAAGAEAGLFGLSWERPHRQAQPAPNPAKVYPAADLWELLGRAGAL